MQNAVLDVAVHALVPTQMLFVDLPTTTAAIDVPEAQMSSIQAIEAQLNCIPAEAEEGTTPSEGGPVEESVICRKRVTRHPSTSPLSSLRSLPLLSRPWAGCGLSLQKGQRRCVTNRMRR